MDLMRDFTFGYYGEAAAPMWEHYSMLLGMWERYHAGPEIENPMLCGIRYYPDIIFLQRGSFLDRALDLLSRAETLAKTAATKQRVRLAEFPLLYLRVSQEIGFVDYYRVFQPRVRAGTKDKSGLSRLLDEFETLCKDEGITHIREGKSDIESKIKQLRDVLSADLADSLVVELPTEWRIKTDPYDIVVEGQWYDERLDDSAWPTVRTDRGCYEDQGFETRSAICWYRQRLRVPRELGERKFCYLYFGAVGDYADVYINGTHAFEHSNDTTAMPVMDIERRPFFFDARPFLRPGEENLIAVRVRNQKSPGGIWKPVWLIGTDHETLPERPG